VETAQSNSSNGSNGSDPGVATPVAKPAVKVAAPKTGANPNFGMNMPMMVSAFDTAAWLKAAA
jgi:hypothetical protein